MRTPRAERLKPVIEMATRAERSAAARMARAQAQLNQAEIKLGDLEGYRSDYQQQWLTNGRQGVGGQWLMNYQRFLSQLEQAITQQQQFVAWQQEQFELARTHWQQRYARLEGLRKLVQRYADEARLSQERSEQKQQDELAQRLARSLDE